jgi:flagellar hook-length control protein FliK
VADQSTVSAEADAVAKAELVAARNDAQLTQQAMQLSQAGADFKPFAAEFTALSRMEAVKQLGTEQVATGQQAPLEGAAQLMGNTAQSNSLPMQLSQFTNPQAPLEPFAQLNYTELAQRVMEQASAARSSGNGTYLARLNLNPPSLGQMYVNIAVRGETVSLQLAVVSTAPKAKLEESVAQLRESLEQSGLHVAELKVVQVGSGSGQSGEGQQGQDSQQHSSQHDTNRQTAVLDTEVTKSAPRVEPSIKAVPAAS